MAATSSACIISVFIKDRPPITEDAASTQFERSPVASASIAKEGICGSFDWHQIKLNQQRYSMTDVGERAVLVQTTGNVAKLVSRFPEAKASLSKSDGSAFGENLLITGFDSSDTCIGDIVHIVSSGGSTQDPNVIFEVASSCAPCAKVAAVHRIKGITPSQGVKGCSAENALRGYFYRVIKEGTISIGDRLELVRRPYPEWTLERVARLCYGGENKHGIMRGFGGTEEELQQLLALAPLAELEWKDSLRQVAQRKLRKSLPQGGVVVLAAVAVSLLIKFALHAKKSYI